MLRRPPTRWATEATSTRQSGGIDYLACRRKRDGRDAAVVAATSGGDHAAGADLPAFLDPGLITTYRVQLLTRLEVAAVRRWAAFPAPCPPNAAVRHRQGRLSNRGMACVAVRAGSSCRRLIVGLTCSIHKAQPRSSVIGDVAGPPHGPSPQVRRSRPTDKVVLHRELRLVRLSMLKILRAVIGHLDRRQPRHRDELD
ncbi:MAG: hypothetical protein U5O16_23325 [Rhodococcus sp. (in: high G+C Gram-positive bacteria)]|uniref:hypothetical protein n=1 Tax=Rhodococcus sp. TaxID=1831 RepID=UPI002ADAFB21|nr:hypothetical protein [Rhodococcus sp. (in: high G+C Gram-positive bacteria)]